jgi:hypothetical protein
MPQRTRSADDKPLEERRTPLDNDVDPDGMDSETEGDDLEAGPVDDEDVDDELRNGADGVVDRRSAHQGRTSGTHGAANADTARPPHRR